MQSLAGRYPPAVFCSAYHLWVATRQLKALQRANPRRFEDGLVERYRGRSALRVGLLGYGRIAEAVHLPILIGSPGVELVGIAEADPARRSEALRRAPGAVASASFEDLLARPEVDAVVICLPPALHADAAITALEAGKHVYLEKPIATNLDDGRRVLAASRDSTAVAMIGFNFRFSRLYREARRQIQAGALGELVGVRSVFTASSRCLPPWKETRERGGGALLDLASHHVDLVRFLTGREVDAVFAAVRSQRSEADTATLHLELGDGLPVQSLFSLSAVDEDRVELYGQAGRLTVDRYRSLGIEITPAGPVRRSDWLLEALRPLARGASLLARLRAPSYEPSYRAALAHFVAAALGARPASPNFGDGYVSLAVIEAAETSARTGRAVALPTMPDETDGERPQAAGVDRRQPACR